MRFSLLIPLVLLGACSASSAAEGKLPDAVVDALHVAPGMEIYALEPNGIGRRDPSLPPVSAQDDFHGYEILGRAALTDPKERAELVGLVLRGIDESDGRVAACFDPRHGIHVGTGEHPLDLLICFECLQVDVRGPDAGPDGRFQALTASTVEPAVTALFGRAGLTIAK